MKAMVLTAPGVNCDREAVEACRLAGAKVEAIHLNQLLQRERRLADFGLLVVPGGFSYGDHLGAGAMLANILRHHLMAEIDRFVADGRLLLGICNGFQVLARLGLLGGVALAPNSSGRFECRWVRLWVEACPCPFLRDLTSLELPVAHGEGRVVAANGGEGGGMVTPPVWPATERPACGEFVERSVYGRFAERGGYVAPLRYCENFNGSVADIAGVCNPAGNVFGLMPHPERYLIPYHHPLWTRRGRQEGGQAGEPPTGLTIFRNAVAYLEAS